MLNNCPSSQKAYMRTSSAMPESDKHHFQGNIHNGVQRQGNSVYVGANGTFVDSNGSNGSSIYYLPQHPQAAHGSTDYNSVISMRNSHHDGALDFILHNSQGRIQEIPKLTHLQCY